jgi:predicted nucleic acid-binding protein
VAGSARYTAILDANVLYPQLVRDLLLSLAVCGLYHARWSADIHAEWTRNFKAKMPDLDSKVDAIVDALNRAVPDCLVTGYERLIPVLELPDADDRHVLAAAIVGHADAIVTFNLRDFPAEVLKTFDIEAQHPDDFVMNQLQLHEVRALTAMKEMRERWKNPSRSAKETVDAARGARPASNGGAPARRFGVDLDVGRSRPNEGGVASVSMPAGSWRTSRGACRGAVLQAALRPRATLRAP